MQLRPYQTDLVVELRDGFRTGVRRQLLVSPTGSGKTVLFSWMTASAASKGSKTWILAHRAEILDQISATLTQAGQDHGVIRSGFAPDPTKIVQVASVQTLVRRMESIGRPNFIVIDEAHHAAAGSWERILAHCGREAAVLGVTATPQRLDGRGLGLYFDKIVMGPSVQSLIEQGYLSRPVYYAPKRIVDLSKVSRRAGDYSTEELEEILNRREVLSNHVGEWLQHANGARTVVFCVDLAHCESVRGEFESRGVRASIIDGTLEPEARRLRIESLKNGSVPVLISCNLISEGFDLPAVGAALLLRPTLSLALHLQQVGRALRPAPGKERALILDCVGNTLRHGLAEEEREWSLEGRAKRKRDALPVRQCSQCYRVFTSAHCPDCGPVRREAAEGINQVNDCLAKLPAYGTPEWKRVMAMKRVAKMKEQGAARTFEDLVELGKKRGYPRPYAWASNILRFREGKGLRPGQLRFNPIRQ